MSKKRLTQNNLSCKFASKSTIFCTNNRNESQVIENARIILKTDPFFWVTLCYDGTKLFLNETIGFLPSIKRFDEPFI